MNYLRPERLQALAARYVTGTMSRRARRRFQRLVDDEPAAEDAVYAQEAQLAPMAWGLAPVTPSPFVWRRVRAEVRRRAPAAGAAGPGRRGWSALAAALLLGVVATSIGWWLGTQRDTPATPVLATPRVAVIADDANRPLWSALLYTEPARATFSVVGAPQPQPDKDYELWLLDEDGTPISLGLLPQRGERTVELPATTLARLGGATTVAVSLEPPGGSPDPVPSGPVLYTGALLAP